MGGVHGLFTTLGANEEEDEVVMIRAGEYDASAAVDDADEMDTFSKVDRCKIDTCTPSPAVSDPDEAEEEEETTSCL